MKLQLVELLNELLNKLLIEKLSFLFFIEL